MMKNDLLDDLSKLDEGAEYLDHPKSVGALLRATAFFFDIMAIIMMLVIGGTFISIFTLIIPEDILSIIYQIMFMASMVLYYPLLESSKLQGSIGKFVVSIKVVDKKGDRLSFLMALGRLMGTVIACTPLFIGIIMIAFTDNRGMQDMMTETYVVKK